MAQLEQSPVNVLLQFDNQFHFFLTVTFKYENRNVCTGTLLIYTSHNFWLLVSLKHLFLYTKCHLLKPMLKCNLVSSAICPMCLWRNELKIFDINSVYFSQWCNAGNTRVFVLLTSNCCLVISLTAMCHIPDFNKTLIYGT